jgi:hypothetical protein
LRLGCGSQLQRIGLVKAVLLVFWAVRVYKIHGPADLSPDGKVTA